MINHLLYDMSRLSSDNFHKILPPPPIYVVALLFQWIFVLNALWLSEGHMAMTISRCPQLAILTPWVPFSEHSSNHGFLLETNTKRNGIWLNYVPMCEMWGQVQQHWCTVYDTEMSGVCAKWVVYVPNEWCMCLCNEWCLCHSNECCLDHWNKWCMCH